MTTIIQQIRERMESTSRETVTPSNSKNLNVSKKVIQVAEQIQAWHKTLPLPDRWYPLQLGRVAARFNVSRELTATALQYGGWIEYRTGGTSHWKKV